MKPHLVGFFLTYCFVEERPVNFTMWSSTLCNSSLETAFEKLLLKWLITGRILNPLSFLSLFALSKKWKVSKNILESLPCHGVCYSLVSNKLPTFPITFNSWQLIDTHNVVYTQKSHHFFHIGLKFKTILLRVQVTLYNNQVHKFLEVGYFPKHIKGCSCISWSITSAFSVHSSLSCGFALSSK